MDTTDMPVLAGIASTVIFASSTLPMLAKAYRTRDLVSYSLGNMVLANLGNLVHAVYVLSLPAGPIWALHGFYTVSTALMLVWFVRYTNPPTTGRREMGEPSDAVAPAASIASTTPSTGGAT